MSRLKEVADYAVRLRREVKGYPPRYYESIMGTICPIVDNKLMAIACNVTLGIETEEGAIELARSLNFSDYKQVRGV